MMEIIKNMVELSIAIIDLATAIIVLKSTKNR